jgi:hypothetical protein
MTDNATPMMSSLFLGISGISSRMSALSAQGSYRRFWRNAAKVGRRTKGLVPWKITTGVAEVSNN